MVSKTHQEDVASVFKSKFNPQELEWITKKTIIVSNIETHKKFSISFSLVSRFISSDIADFNENENQQLEGIYPGFGKSKWSKQDLARTLLMVALDTSVNKQVLFDFFQIAEMKELIALYKGLYFLENASEFKAQYAEGIRTNMGNVFDAIASGNPYAKAYLDEEAWNQLILKSFFMDRKIYNIQDIDKGKNEHLAFMLQDYVKERWAAGRQVSLEIWRMIDGYIRDDIKALFSEKQFEGSEKKVIAKLLDNRNTISPAYWDTIGKTN